jgi:cytochrome b561
MPFRNTKLAWGSLSKALHWIIVLLIINQWLIIQRAHSLPKGPALISALAWHKSFGITVLLLAVVRLLWRWMNPVPDLSAETRPWERVLAKVSHVLLYVLIFALPLSGWTMSSARSFPVSWFGWVQLPDLVAPNPDLYKTLHEVHEVLFNVLVVVAALHVAGALKHHFIDRNDVLKRMLPFGGAR